ncbi:MAG: AMP-binding protein, partial [Deltaproteobacteria bacterium]|nr:AMP-binding protein [Deltaproteobacteria bacterium]
MDQYLGKEKLLHDIVEEIAEKTPQKTAMMYMGRHFTYRDFVVKFQNFSAALTNLGVRENDNVGVYLPNTPQSLISFYGISGAGATVILLSAIYSTGELSYILKENRVKTVVCTDINIGNIMRVRKEVGLENIIVTRLDDELPIMKRLIARGFDKVPLGHTPKDRMITSYQNLMKKTGAQLPRRHGNPEKKPLFIVYTGGTTGTPKGVPHTHSEMIHAIASLNTFLQRHIRDLKEGKEIWAGYQPFDHMAGLMFFNLPILRRETVVIFPTPDIDAILTEFRRRKITCVAGAPTFFTMILGNLRLEQYLPGLKAVKYYTSGADALPEEVFRRWQGSIGKELLQTWGASEMFVATHNVPGEADLSLGRVLPGYEVALLETEEDRFLDRGDTGELAVKSHAILKRYLNKPDETRASLVEINGDIWYRSGDIGFKRDEKFYFQERKREIIKYKGYNIGASEVEQALYAHEAVKEAAVIGVPDKNVGEMVKAAVVLHEDARNVTLHDLLEVCRERLSPYKIPKHIEIRDS